MMFAQSPFARFIRASPPYQELSGRIGHKRATGLLIAVISELIWGGGHAISLAILPLLDLALRFPLLFERNLWKTDFLEVRILVLLLPKLWCSHNAIFRTSDSKKSFDQNSILRGHSTKSIVFKMVLLCRPPSCSKLDLVEASNRVRNKESREIGCI